MTTELFPILSFRERDRRWRAARELMDEHELAALVVLSGHVLLDAYLAGESLGGFAFLPREGEPVLVTGADGSLFARFDDAGREQDRWIEDLRLGPTPVMLPRLLRERGLARERIGLVGLTTVGYMRPSYPVKAWRHLQSALEDFTVLDVSAGFERMTMVKSAEELVLVRHAAMLGEAACEAFLDVAAVGVRESEIKAAALAAVLARGGHLPHAEPLIRSGRGILLGKSEWGVRGGEPRRVRHGDLIASELFSDYGGYDTQQQMHVVVGEPDPLHLQQAEVARAANEAGAAAARPGVRFSELCQTMTDIVLDAGFWSRAPVAHTLCTSHTIDGPRMVGADQQPALRDLPVPLPPTRGVVPEDIELRAGMVLALQTGACQGLTGVTLGGTVVVGDNGAEELNELPRRLHVKSA